MIVIIVLLVTSVLTPIANHVVVHQLVFEILVAQNLTLSQNHLWRSYILMSFLKRSGIKMKGLYTDKKIETIKLYSSDKKKNQCSTCGLYCHKADGSKFKTPFCFQCRSFGNITKKYLKKVRYYLFCSLWFNYFSCWFWG